LFRRSIDIQQGKFSVLREKQRKTVTAHLDVCIAVRVRARDVDTWEIDSDTRHRFTVDPSIHGSSVDASQWRFELDELLTCLRLAPQPDRPPEQSTSLRVAVFIDQLLNAGDPFRPLRPIGRHHSLKVPPHAKDPLSRIAQPWREALGGLPALGRCSIRVC